MYTGIDYVICAAGAGSRLKSLAFGKPKPLIKVKGRTLLLKSLDSLNVCKKDQLIFVVQKADRIREELGAVLTELYPQTLISWVEIDFLTSGQLASAYLAYDKLRGDGIPVAIFNSDTYFKSPELSFKILSQKYDGIIPCQWIGNVEGSHFSFCKTQENSELVTEVTEKIRISDWASVGFYYFRTAELFGRLAQKFLNLPPQNAKEHYIAPIYNEIIAEGGSVVIDAVDLFLPLGTPAEIVASFKISEDEVKDENRKGTLVFDLDETLTLEGPGLGYDSKPPNWPVIKRLIESYEAGYTIVLHTARRMRTYSNDESRVVANIADITLAWLKKHNIPFHGLKFGKPFAENGFYIDDRAIRPSEYLQMSDGELLGLIKPADDKRA